MARIRTVKPEFFRHEALQDYEAKHPLSRLMLVFIGLWTVSDRAGRFEWRPRQLKLDILPFLDFDMEDTLSLLEGGGFLMRYEVEGKAYGLIPSFEKHQRFTGKEALDPPRYPAPTEGSIRECPNVSQGSNREATEIPGKGKGKGKGIEKKEAPGGNENSTGVPIGDGADPVLMELPCVGGGVFHVTQATLDGWKEAFPGLDYLGEARRMQFWLRGNPQKQKTPKGMGRFFSTWLGNAADRLKANGQGKGAEPKEPTPREKMAADYLAANADHFQEVPDAS